jgi:hypothetical protein
MNRRPDYKGAPLKGISRHMIAEIARRLVAYGDLSDMTYVGLGGLEFIDFSVMYDSLGLGRMYSIESTESKLRVDYNRPFDKIVNLKGTTTERLPEIDALGVTRSVVWLDYVDTMHIDAQKDLAYLAGKVLPGSAIFVSFNSYFTSETDLEEVEKKFGDYWDNEWRRRDFLGWNGADRQRDVAENIMGRAIRARMDKSSLLRILDLRYKDSAKMQVVGWLVTDEPDEVADKLRLLELPFTTTARSDTPLEIRWPDLTALEWNALHRQMPHDDPTTLIKPHADITETTLLEFAAVHRFARRQLSA